MPYRIAGATLSNYFFPRVMSNTQSASIIFPASKAIIAGDAIREELNRLLICQ